MALLDQIQRDMVAAMKAKEEVRLGAVRMIKTVLIKWQADNSKPLDEAAELLILSILVKQRKESIDMFRNAGREEAAAKGMPFAPPLAAASKKFLSLAVRALAAAPADQITTAKAPARLPVAVRPALHPLITLRDPAR